MSTAGSVVSVNVDLGSQQFTMFRFSVSQLNQVCAGIGPQLVTLHQVNRPLDMCEKPPCHSKLCLSIICVLGMCICECIRIYTHCTKIKQIHCHRLNCFIHRSWNLIRDIYFKLTPMQTQIHTKKNIYMVYINWCIYIYIYEMSEISQATWLTKIHLISTLWILPSWFERW